MTSREQILHLVKILDDESSKLYDDPIVEVSLDNDDVSVLKKGINGLGIQCERFGSDAIRIDLSQFEDQVYFDENHFLRENSVERVNGILDNTIHIINTDKYGYLYYDPEEQKTFKGNGEPIEYYLICNQSYFAQFFDLLNTSKITDYYSKQHREFLLTSTEQPKFKLGYRLPQKEMVRDTSMKYVINEFEEIVNLQEYYLFFKEAIIKILTNTNQEDRLYTLFKDFKQVQELAEREFEIFAKKFSFQELKKDLRKEKEKYFASLREIINKLLNKVVTIPISISATAFAVYRLKEDALLGTFILLAFIIYAGFTYYLLKIIQGDTEDIKEEFRNDVATIIAESGLPQKEIKATQRLVENKIDRLSNTIIILQAILVAISIAMLVIGLDQLGFTVGNTGILIILLGFFLYILEEYQANLNGEYYG